MSSSSRARTPRLRGGILLLAVLAAAGCRKSTPPQPHRLKPVAQSETPQTDKILAESADDSSWLAGTWKKDGESRWLLFNVPSEAAELAGQPARVVRRGKLVVHGRFVSALFDDGELHLEASPDHGELSVSGAHGVYRRGAPP